MRSKTLACLGLFTGLTCGVATAATINVPADQPTIQAAIVAASAGDTITVDPGTYAEANILIDKAVDIVGSGIGSTIVDPPGSGNAFLPRADGITVTDLTVTDASQAFRFELAAGTIDDTTIERVEMTGNSSRGVEVHNATTASNLTMDSCIFDDTSTGLRIASSATGVNLAFTDCVFADNTIGIYEANDGSTSTLTGLTVTGCTFTNHSSYAIFLEEVQGASIAGNTFVGNYRDIQLFKWYQASVPMSDVDIRDNVMLGTENAVFAIFNAEHSSGQTTFDGITFENNRSTSDTANSIYMSGHDSANSPGGLGWDTVHVNCNDFVGATNATQAGLRFFNPGVSNSAILGGTQTIDVTANWWGTSDDATIDALMVIPSVAIHDPYLTQPYGPTCPQEVLCQECDACDFANLLAPFGIGGVALTSTDPCFGVPVSAGAEDACCDLVGVLVPGGTAALPGSHPCVAGGPGAP